MWHIVRDVPNIPVGKFIINPILNDISFDLMKKRLLFLELKLILNKSALDYVNAKKLNFATLIGFEYTTDLHLFSKKLMESGQYKLAIICLYEMELSELHKHNPEYIWHIYYDLFHNDFYVAPKLDVYESNIGLVGLNKHSQFGFDKFGFKQFFFKFYDSGSTNNSVDTSPCCSKLGINTSSDFAFKRFKITDVIGTNKPDIE